VITGRGTTNILKCPALINPSIRKKKSQDIPLFHQSNREQLLSIFYNHGNLTLQYLKAGPKSAKSISKMFGVGGGAMHVHVHHQRSRSFNNKNTV
jgi:hypothetical protein